LKAIFFVRDFVGNPDYTKMLYGDASRRGRKVVVTFHDGEELSGTTEAYSSQRLGFSVFPHDESGNNLRV
jgi:hypothetical protein